MKYKYIFEVLRKRNKKF